MARTYLNADTFAIYKKEGNKEFLIGAQTEVKIKIEPEFEEFKAFDIAGTEQSFKGYKYSIDLSGVAVRDEEALNTLFTSSLNGTALDIAFYIGSVKYAGQVNIASFELGGSTKELASYSIPLVGNGVLTTVDAEGQTVEFKV